MSLYLRDYVCGRNGRAFQVVRDGVTLNLAPKNQASPLSGSLVPSMSGTVFSSTDLYDIDSIARLYSESSTVSCPVQLDPTGVSGRVLAMTQVGDAGYLLTREVLEGFSETLKVTDDADQDVKRFDLWPAVHRQAFSLSSDSRCSPSVGHELAKYYSSGDAHDRSYGVSGLTALLLRNWLDENMVDEMPYAVSASVSASWLAAAEDLESSLLFDVERRICETSFDFQGRQRLLAVYNGGQMYALTGSDEFYSHSEGLPNAYALEWRTTDDNYPAGELELSVNPMRLKGFYDSAYQPETDATASSLTGCRNYVDCGTMQDSFWLSYKMARDLDDSAWVTRDFAHVERVRGLYKLSSGARHKSNLFSLRLRDTGLNSRMDSLTGSFDVNGSGSPVLSSGTQFKAVIQKVVEEELRGMMVRIAPANAELWKVTWEGS